MILDRFPLSVLTSPLSTTRGAAKALVSLKILPRFPLSDLNAPSSTTRGPLDSIGDSSFIPSPNSTGHRRIAVSIF
ncbi:hypothetical protein Dimus_015506 [Dionaea muscipula]